MNTASRLETLTKDFACELVESDDVAARAGGDLSGFELREIAIHGREQPLGVRIIPQAAPLPAV